MIVHSVIETPTYLSDAKSSGLTEAERQKIVDSIAANAMSGTEIPGAGGARKLRFGGRGKGKSGGFRVITFYGGLDIPVFLLNVFAKGDRVDLSQAERNALRAGLAALASDYRKGVGRYVKGR